MSGFHHGRDPPGIRDSGNRDISDEEATNLHRLRSNAFYQQEIARRKEAAPPRMNHPANRDQHEAPQSTHHSSIGANSRSSRDATMPSLLNCSTARERSQLLQRDRELMLVPECQVNAAPTVRGMIEDRAEFMAWNASGQTDERTPVYTYSPKPDVGSIVRKDSNAGSSSAQEHLKSPKKNIFDRLGFSRSKSSTKDTEHHPATPASENVAPKAAAVFGMSASTKRMVSSLQQRASAHKRDQQGSRNAANLGDMSTPRVPIDPASLVDHSKHPYYAAVTPTPNDSASKSGYTEGGGRRFVSEPEEQAQQASDPSALARAQSLHYYDKGVPPTPPSKDTPPELKRDRSSLPAECSTTQPKTPHRRRTNSMLDETPCKRLQIPNNDKHQKTGHGGGWVTSGKPTVMHQPKPLKADHVTLVRHGKDVTDVKQVKKVEETLNLVRGLDPDGNLPMSAYSPASPPSYLVRPVYSPDKHQAETGINAIGEEGNRRRKVRLSFALLTSRLAAHRHQSHDPRSSLHLISTVSFTVTSLSSYSTFT